MTRPESLGEWLFHQKLSRKIITIFCIFFLISFCLTYTLYSFIARTQANQVMEQTSQQMITSAKNNMEEIVRNVNDNFSLLLKSGTLELVAELPQPKDRKAYNNILFTVLDSNHYLESIYLLDLSAHLYGMDKHDIKRLSVDAIFKCPWYEKARAAKGGYILANDAGGIFYKGYQSQFISVIRVINNMKTQKPQGFIIMNISTSNIEAMFERVFENSQASIGLYDQNNQLAAKSSQFSHQDSYDSVSSGCNSQQLYTSSRVEDSLICALYLPEHQWKLIADFPAQRQNVRSKWLLMATSLIFVINAVVMLVCTFYISRSIANPIKGLIRVMNTVKNRDFHKIKVEHPKSEIGILQENYNNMVEEISSLLSRLVEEQKIKQKAELHALQEQVKPHFLYNTLDAIGYMALVEDPAQTYEAIETLGSFYRQCLNLDCQLIPLKKEAAIVMDYVKLLKLRYGDLFEITYDIPPECQEVFVPHLILQPLVENSIYHGIKPMGGDGLIQITAALCDQISMTLTVRDNGVGIAPHILQKLQDYHTILNVDIDVTGTGIGLIGTIQRFVLIYGDGASYRIQSEPNCQTTIELSLPTNHIGDEISCRQNIIKY